MTLEMKLRDARAEGRLQAVMESVREGDYTAERGAQKLGIPLEEFYKLMQKETE